MVSEGCGIRQAGSKGRPSRTPESARDIEEFGVRLRQVVTELYGDRGNIRFARALGISSRSVYNWGIRFGVEPQARVVLRIIVLTGVSPRWLLDGTGPMFTPKG